MVAVTVNKISLMAVLVSILIALVGVNQYIIFSTDSNLGKAQITGGAVSTGSAVAPTQGTTTQGTTEYGVSFSESGFNALVGYSKLSLTSEQQQRFIRIGTMPKTACEACCGIGTGSAIDSNGNARCGCGHNYALIGLMKYLVKNYGDKYTDQQILDEVAKWKVFFFPQLAGGAPTQSGSC